MYEKKFEKYDVTCSWTPLPSVTNCHTFSDPLPSCATYFMDGPIQLNRSKCKVVTNDPGLLTEYSSFSRKLEMATLLGAPLSSSGALSIVLESRSRELLHALDRLDNIARHDALVLLRHSLSSSKLLYILRCFSCAGHPGLERFDSAHREGLCKVTEGLTVHQSWWTGNSISCLACTSRLFGFSGGYPFAPVNHHRRKLL